MSQNAKIYSSISGWICHTNKHKQVGLGLGKFLKGKVPNFVTFYKIWDLTYLTTQRHILTQFCKSPPLSNRKSHGPIPTVRGASSRETSTFFKQDGRGYPQATISLKGRPEKKHFTLTGMQHLCSWELRRRVQSWLPKRLFHRRCRTRVQTGIQRTKDDERAKRS